MANLSGLLTTGSIVYERWFKSQQACVQDITRPAFDLTCSDVVSSLRERGRILRYNYCYLWDRNMILTTFSNYMRQISSLLVSWNAGPWSFCILSLLRGAEPRCYEVNRQPSNPVSLFQLFLFCVIFNHSHILYKKVGHFTPKKGSSIIMLFWRKL